VRKYIFVISFFLFFSCSSKRVIECKNNYCDQEKVNQLVKLYEENLGRAKELLSPDGWITPNSCDGMLWSSKYGAIDCNSFSPEAAERDYGRFGRRPSPPCWDGEDKGSKTTWSRDMGVGFIAYAIACKKDGLLLRHIEYGKKHHWMMGFPVTDLRAFYTPQIRDLLFDSVEYIRGTNDYNRSIEIYPSGLKDYQAHLQVMSIWIRRHWEGINSLKWERLMEHYTREPYNPFYSYMTSFYKGDLNETIDLLLDPRMPMSDYVRCDDPKRCKLAEWLFVAGQVIRELE